MSLWVKEERGYGNGIRTLYTCTQRNIDGEELYAELSRGYDKHGNDIIYADVSVSTFAPSGIRVWNHDYNPQIQFVKRLMKVSNGNSREYTYAVSVPEWKLPYSEENKQKLLEEVYNRFIRRLHSR